MLGALISTIFLVLAIVHVYWALGGQSGKLAAVPGVDGRPSFRPSPLGTLLVAVGLVAATAVIAGTMGWIESPVRVSTLRVLTLALSLMFFLRAVGDFRHVGFFKPAGQSRFGYWDSLVYSPLCLGIAVATFLVARWTR
jgi:uncharacterized membrane protein YciS (DUF1049 family)